MMRIATWNLERPSSRQARRRARLREEIRRVNADVWILTETHEEIDPGPDFRAVATIGEDRPQEPGERWTMVWSRYPVRPLPTNADPARTVAALVEAPLGHSLIVYGTVLPWLGSPWRGLAAANGEAFAAALEAQLEDWVRLRAEMPEANFCVGGDLNQDLSDRHYYGSHRNRNALESALDRAKLVCVTAGAFDPVHRQTSGTYACIDHICVCEQLARRARERKAWPETDSPDPTLSDHFGVVVEFAET